ncbi:hypothetical protein QWZ10_01380 [Paracoccus cavernae]|uniref:Uncharacterized protein n=1 Tax=Paracoccus cavernae TaxID=1571207 RepID=A0ABT8D4M9_9RHOB|nr:hypothetical protein [Paracoccus cavernae]
MAQLVVEGADKIGLDEKVVPSRGGIVEIARLIRGTGKTGAAVMQASKSNRSLR